MTPEKLARTAYSELQRRKLSADVQYVGRLSNEDYDRIVDQIENIAPLVTLSELTEAALAWEDDIQDLDIDRLISLAVERKLDLRDHGNVSVGVFLFD